MKGVGEMEAKYRLKIVGRWFSIALINLAIAACMGLLLRYFFIGDTGSLNFKYILHAHSHTGMLGWIYSGLFAFIYLMFVPVGRHDRTYNRLFYGSQIAVLGMLLSFPFQGYGAVSIAFSTFHMLLSYAFIYRVYRGTRSGKGQSSLFLRTAMFWMAFSTLGVWAMGPVIGILGRDSLFYDAAIQFFLHFQFNGWFVFATAALLFRKIEVEKRKPPRKLVRRFYWTLAVSCVLTYALSIPDLLGTGWFSVLGLSGTALQILALAFLYFAIRVGLKGKLISVNNLASRFYSIVFLVFALRVIFQFGWAWMNYFDYMAMNRFLIVGVIHLTLLGVVSVFLIALANEHGLIVERLAVRWSWYIFISGFTLSELLIFLQGLAIEWQWVLPPMHKPLFWISALMPAGIIAALILNGMRKNRPEATGWRGSIVYVRPNIKNRE